MGFGNNFSASIPFALVSLHMVVVSEKMKIFALPRQEKKAGVSWCDHAESESKMVFWDLCSVNF